MIKSIYKEAIKVVTYLQEQNSHLKDNCGTIYISTENITTLENLLIYSQKQEELLKLYEKLAEYRLIVINSLLDEIIDFAQFDTINQFIDYIKYEAKRFGDADTIIVGEIEKIKEKENELD